MANMSNYIEIKSSRIKSHLNTLIIGLFIILCIISFFVGRYTKKNEVEVVTKRDTVVCRDTFNFIKTEIEFRDRYFYDTVEIERVVYVRDTPQTYTDSTDKYKLKINCVKLYDYDLSIYTTDSTFYTETILKEKESFWKNRFTITAGFGMQYGLINKQVDIGPQLTFGIRLW